MKKSFIISIGCMLVMSMALTSRHERRVQIQPKEDSPPHSPPGMKTKMDFGKMPLYFIANEGQMDEQVDFYVQGKDKTLYFTPEGITFVLTRSREDVANKSLRELDSQDNKDLSPEKTKPADRRHIRDEIMERASSERWVVKLDFLGANPGVRPEGIEKTEAIISYFKGKPEEWKAGLPTYSKIVYRDLWPGIDLIYFGTVNKLKYELVVRPGVDPLAIRLAYRGVNGVAVTEDGRLEVATPLGNFLDGVPVAYQDVDGERANVDLEYRIEEKDSNSAIDCRSAGQGIPCQTGGDPETKSYSYGFRVGKYDCSVPLVLDPAILIYCGYIGGSNNDYASGIAVGTFGNVYVVGQTYSSESSFPVAVGPYLIYESRGDAYVAKVSSSGTTMVYCGYINGSNEDIAYDIAVDSDGNAYVAGATTSDEATFPVVGGLDVTHNGAADAFLAKVNPAGTGLIYCGYVGGFYEDAAFGVAIDGSGSAYITGYTNSSEASFPVKIGPDLSFNGFNDAFMAKVSSSGSLVYCGYVGGSEDDFSNDIAVDGNGNAYITGETSSSEDTFPVILGPDLSYNAGMNDAFVAKANCSGADLIYCGYIGGSSYEFGEAIALCSNGSAYVAGYTGSSEDSFPVKVGPDLTYNGYTDAFVARLNSEGTSLVFCGYIGGSGSDSAASIAVDAEGNIYIAGGTTSTEASFPVKIGPDLTFNGGSEDVFVAKVCSSGSNLIYCGYIGGSNGEWQIKSGIAVDSRSNVFISGTTYSTESTFPVGGGPDLTHNGYTDAFVAKVFSIGPFPVFDGHDYDGNLTSDVSLWRPSNAFWYIKDIERTGFGTAGDIPASGDYDGNGTSDIAIFRPSTAMWAIKDQFRVYYGLPGDIPVPGDYDGNGTTDVAIYRPSTGMWAVKDKFTAYLGGLNEVPVPGDYDGDGDTDVAVFNVMTGHWRVKDQFHAYVGTMGDTPVPADYDGDGATDVAIFRPSSGMWVISGQPRVYYGNFGDIPAPGDYDGNGTADIAVFRPSIGLWAVKDQFRVYYGQVGDIPLVR